MKMKRKRRRRMNYSTDFIEICFQFQCIHCALYLRCVALLYMQSTLNRSKLAKQFWIWFELCNTNNKSCFTREKKKLPTKYVSLNCKMIVGDLNFHTLILRMCWRLCKVFVFFCSSRHYFHITLHTMQLCDRYLNEL